MAGPDAGARVPRAILTAGHAFGPATHTDPATHTAVKEHAVADAFYASQGDGRFTSSKNTAGPWSPDSQHFGPPAALLTRALEACESAEGKQLTRITVEILGPAPIEDLWVSAEIDRPGRSVELLSATLRTAERPVARANAWRIARSETEGHSTGTPQQLPPVDQGVEFGRPEGWSSGYLDAMQWIGISGTLAEPGPAIAWIRQRIPLVDAEEPTPLQRLMAVADSASGISTWLNPAQWWFINTELTVHITREPTGEWIGMDANTVIGPTGAGTALSTLHDQDGPVGHTAQALMIRPR